MAENVTYTLFQMAKEMDAEIARLRAENEQLRAAPAISGGECCSAISPCAHQRKDPTTICDVCQRAALAAADRSAS